MRNKTKQTDRRVIRTKKEILNALTKLLEQKSIEEITVREITDLAGINRGTFYLHYVDKYDLLEKSVNTLILQLRDIGVSVMKPIEEYDTPDEKKEDVVSSLTFVFEYVKDNGRFIRSLLSENSTYSFHHKFNEILKDTFIEQLKVAEPRVPPLYLAAAMSYAFQGLINTWLRNDMKETPREMGEYGYEIYSHFMSSTLYGTI